MNAQKIELSEKDKQRLTMLAEVIEWGTNAIPKQIKISDLSLKQVLLYLNFVAINNYSEGIYRLCMDMRPFPAIVVLRSIVEAYINIGYILSHNSNKRAILFSMEDSYYRKGLSIEILTFLRKYPQFEKDDFKKEAFELGIEKTDAEIKLYKDNFNLSYESKGDFEKDYHNRLLERAKTADKKYENPDFEYVYILVYKHYSEFGHLNSRGLDHFIKKGTKGNVNVIAGQHVEVDHVISMTYTIYLYFLKELKKRKILKKKFPLRKFRKNWKKI